MVGVYFLSSPTVSLVVSASNMLVFPLLLGPVTTHLIGSGPAMAGRKKRSFFYHKFILCNLEERKSCVELAMCSRNCRLGHELIR